MSWLRRSEDLVIATLDGRRAGELLAHPCGCGNHDGTAHSLGQHLWDATKDMTPNGVSAVTYEAKGSSATSDTDAAPAAALDPHDQYRRLVDAWRNTALDLAAFIEKHRPDRHLEAVQALSDDQWCRACLAAGYCSTLLREGPLCRWCTEFALAYRMDPPAELLVARAEGRRITQPMVDAAVRAERQRLKAERRKKRTA